MIPALLALVSCEPASPPLPIAPRPVTPSEPTSPPATTPTTPPPVRHLDEAALFTRISLDLRGVRPSLAELDRLEARGLLGPDGLLDEVVDEWLEDPRFSERLMDLFDDLYSLRTGNYYVHFDVLAMRTGLTEAGVMGHVADEPLQALALLAREDLPVETFVTSDWTMADEVLAGFYPVDYPAGATGWRQVHYTDERPPVGVLASNAMWWLHGSMENNRNRNRANFLSRAFLCSDYLEREVPELDGELVGTPEGMAEAISNDPACVSCHQTLEPLASHFYGFWWFDVAAAAPDIYTVYHPEREFLWRDLTGVAPGYFGQPSSGLADLGRLVADDPRYAPCFVENTWQLVTRTDVDEVPVDLAGLEQAFDASGHRIKALFRAMIHHPAYQGEDERHTARKMSPSLLSSQIHDLTGYTWTSRESGRDLLASPEGYHLLAGGFDRDVVQFPARSETVTSVLVHQRLSESAARHVVDHDRTSAEKRLFTEIDFTETPEGEGRDRMVAQIGVLHRRVFGRRVAADGPEVAADLAYWTAARDATGDLELAWAALLSLMLRDPEFVTW